MKKILIGLATFCCLSWAVSALAVPALQLDISDAVYDAATETVTSTSDVFTLYALIDPSQVDSTRTFYISAAVMPGLDQVQPAPALGTFSFAGTSYDVTGDMVYGTPPVDDDLPDLGPHDVYDTYYIEFDFTFDPSFKSVEYNVEDNPGEFTVLSNENDPFLYYKEFMVDVSDLVDGYEIHFDFYTFDDNDRLIKAPFSHDAQSGGDTPPIPAPEPSTLLLLGAGLVGLGGWARRFKK